MLDTLDKQDSIAAPDDKTKMKHASLEHARRKAEQENDRAK